MIQGPLFVDLEGNVLPDPVRRFTSFPPETARLSDARPQRSSAQHPTRWRGRKRPI